jgi:hypothetical protein
MTTENQVLMLKDINQRNAQFWSARAELMKEQRSDERLVRIVMCQIEQEAVRGVPIYYRRTFEAWLDDAANAKATFHTEPSRKGGQAPKADPLSNLIVDLHKEDPQMNGRQLFHALRKEVGKGVIISIDPDGPQSKIHFVAADGKVKTASLSGLKHRLSRARKKNIISVAG